MENINGHDDIHDVDEQFMIVSEMHLVVYFIRNEIGTRKQEDD